MVAFPRPLPAVPFLDFRLELRRFVSSAQSGGHLTNVVEYADPVWMASASAGPIRPSDVALVEAWWSSLRDGLRTVLARSPRYCTPRAHINARGPETQAGTVGAVTSGNRLTINGVNAGLVLSPGDLVTFEQGAARGLGRVVEATGSGASRTVEIEPNFPRRLSTGAVARFDRAELLMRPVPRSFSLDGRTASFQLIESRA